ncbi:MAG: hypothetical protein IH987_16525 [Planctomycetes bacterium]|nr:hypothetical protein [Planctomycetota bacterium]
MKPVAEWETVATGSALEIGALSFFPQIAAGRVAGNGHRQQSNSDAKVKEQ